LSSAEAAYRLRVDGPNVLPRARPPAPAVLLLRQLTHFFAVMLWVAALLAWIAGLPQLAVAIAVVVVVNGVFAFAQEYRADRAGERLADLMPARCTVIRDGHRSQVPASDLVVGDTVVLEAGDRVSADLHLQAVTELAVDESMLTGESVPVRPAPDGPAYAGTFVTEGEAWGEVIATDGRTRLGGLAELTRSAQRPRSPLAIRLHRVVVVVAMLAVAVGAAFFGIATLLGMPASDGFLFAVGVTVALVPEGLLPTVTLSLARAAQVMARRHALVRRLESVETLGSTTFICTDKTGTLTCNEMSVVRLWTPAGVVQVIGEGYAPTGRIDGPTGAVAMARTAALMAARCSTGRLVRRGEQWTPIGDPMEVALHVLALRTGANLERDESVRPTARRLPFDPHRRRMSVVVDGQLLVKGAPDAVLPRCHEVAGAAEAVTAMSESGLRVLAVAHRRLATGESQLPADLLEIDLELVALVGLEDPPRPGVREAIAACRTAGIRLAMVTGDHPGTAAAIAREVGLLRDGRIVSGSELPADDSALGQLLDRDGVVVARVSPEDKLRIARALHGRGHIVAMTGDGVNDGPALREADIGIAMGRSGTDVAREAADLVLLDDAFATIVSAVELGRATFANIRRFLTYHLTDNVAELTPFVVWALSAGQIPLAIGVLQVLALDIGTDLLPALALGAEPPSPNVLRRPASTGNLIDRRLAVRVFGVLGPAEAVVAMGAFLAVLVAGGWRWGMTPESALAASASGAAFSAIVLGQLANAFACRSETRWVGRLDLAGNRLLLGAVASELIVLGIFLGVPFLADLLGGAAPTALGWVLAAAAIPTVLVADAAAKRAWPGHRGGASGTGIGYGRPT
jgi:magnesium-transporting ATPase (P-type)